MFGPPHAVLRFPNYSYLCTYKAPTAAFSGSGNPAIMEREARSRRELQACEARQEQREQQEQRRPEREHQDEQQGKSGKSSESIQTAIQHDRLMPLLGRCAASPGVWGWGRFARLLAVSLRASRPDLREPKNKAAKHQESVLVKLRGRAPRPRSAF